MRQQICYLYEYKESIPVKNVGFVRIEERKEGVLFKICAKKILTQEREQMEICGFRMRHRFCETVTLGTAYMTHGTLVSSIETEEKPDSMDGVLIRREGKVCFAAVWNKVPVNFTECVRREEIKDSEEKNTVSEEIEVSLKAGEDAVQEIAEAPVLEQEVAETSQGSVEQEEACKKAGEKEVRKENKEEKEAEEAMTELHCRKIGRNDLGELARQEWRLANNSFLLHGYYNYHHLLLIEKGDRCVLGVPGIYHRRERQAAECFGFTEFREAEKLPVTLSATERNDYERFGYWCRAVEKGMGKNISKRN